MGIGECFLIGIAALISIYIVSRIMMRAWLKEFDQYLTKKFKNHEQEKKK